MRFLSFSAFSQRRTLYKAYGTENELIIRLLTLHGYFSLETSSKLARVDVSRALIFEISMSSTLRDPTVKDFVTTYAKQEHYATARALDFQLSKCLQKLTVLSTRPPR